MNDINLKTVFVYLILLCGLSSLVYANNYPVSRLTMNLEKYLSMFIMCKALRC